jgi:shikimate dehydrogenase
MSVPVFGLTGYPLSHSFSPRYFSEKFARQGIQASYQLFPLPDISGLRELISLHPQLLGLNVTIPHKETVLPYLDILSEEARAIGAVNCIHIKNKLLTGYNTDVTGFSQSLTPLLQPYHTRALILGTGGAAKAVRYALDHLGIEWKEVSRTPAVNQLGYEALDADVIQSYPLIINTTPLGMYPHTDACPALPYEALGPEHLLYDLIYNPEETFFLARGKARGARTKNGLEMLELQAEASWHIWQNV